MPDSSTTRLVATGSYSRSGTGRADGVDLLEVQESGEIRRLAAVSLEDPSFLLWHPAGELLYAVHETTPTQVSALRLDAEASWLEVVRTVTLRGAGGCHLALGHDARSLFVADYGSGVVETLGLDEDGLPTEVIDLDDHHDMAGDRHENLGDPHPHQCVRLPGTDLIAVPDLGLDAVFLYRTLSEGGIDLAGQISVSGGSGPRHLAADHESAEIHISCEKSGMIVTAIRREDEADGSLRWSARSSVQASGSDVPNAVSHIELSQRENHLLVANRGPNTLSALSLGQMRPELIAEIAVGEHPRHFSRVGTLTLVAAQESDRIDVLSWDGRDFSVTAEPFGSPSVTCIAPRP